MSWSKFITGILSHCESFIEALLALNPIALSISKEFKKIASISNFFYSFAKLNILF